MLQAYINCRVGGCSFVVVLLCFIGFVFLFLIAIISKAFVRVVLHFNCFYCSVVDVFIRLVVCVIFSSVGNFSTLFIIFLEDWRDENDQAVCTSAGHGNGKNKEGT